jgi:hypothetical protein
MTVTPLCPEPDPEPGLLGKILRRTRKALDPHQLTLSKYKLSKKEKGELVVRGFVLTFVAALIGSSIYFLTVQRAWGFKDPPAHGAKTSNWNTYWAWKDLYDNAPIRIQNWLNSLGWHVHVFHSQVVPDWYVAARHDFRHFLIGLIAALLVSSITIGLGKKDYIRVPNWKIPVVFLEGILVAIPVAIISIGFFAWFLPHGLGVDINGWGASIGGVAGEWIGKGAWESTLCGALAGLGMKKVIKPAQATIQLISMENHLNDHDEVKRWWRVVYGPNYTKRYAYLQETDHQPERHGAILGLLMALAAPVSLALIGFAIWNLYLGGPATGVH